MSKIKETIEKYLPIVRGSDMYATNFDKAKKCAILEFEAIIKEVESIEFNYEMEDMRKETAPSKTVIPYYKRLILETDSLTSMPL